MAIKLERRCIDCGEIFYDGADVEAHIVANPKHVIIEQCFDNAYSGVPSAVSIRDKSGKNVKIEADENGRIMTGDDDSTKKYDGSIIFSVDKSTKNSSYTTIARFIFNGTDITGDIESIEFIGKMQSSNSSYSLRIIDHDNSNVICEKVGLTNTRDEVFAFDSFGNLPESKTIFEIQMKSGTNQRRSYCRSISLKT